MRIGLTRVSVRTLRLPSTSAVLKTALVAVLASTGFAVAGVASSSRSELAIATTTTATFKPVADARVEEAHRSTNYGTSKRLGSDGDNGARIESDLRFNLSGLSGTVQTATLRLYVVNDPTADGPAVYPTSNDWTETGVTWATRPVATGPAAADMGVLAAGRWVQADVTPLVKGNGTVNLLLKQPGTDGVIFYSREKTGSGPELVVTTSTATTTNTTTTATSTTTPSTVGAPPYRYMYNSGSDQKTVASYGWNLLDVSDKSSADALPAGTRALVWVGDYNNGSCSWQLADSKLTSLVSSMVGDPKVAGYFFSDEPDPYACPSAPAVHKARSQLIHSIDPNRFTVVVLDSNSGQSSVSQIPLWVGVADYIGLDPYPCYQGRSCDYAWIDTIISAADRAGLAYWGVVQAFNDSTWRWPTATEEQHMLNQWAASKEKGYMTFAWTWSNNNLSSQPGLMSVLRDFNNGGSSGGGTTVVTTTAATTTGATTTSDTTPPSAPGGFTATSSTQTNVSLSWNASTDNVGVSGYEVFLAGTRVATTTSRSYTVGGLACGTSYTFAVDAYDAAGNRSAKTTIGATTSACSGSGDPVIAAAGDICGSSTDCAPTAALLDQINPTRVLTLGDNAYNDGTLSQYMSYYDPNWGRHKSVTSPSPGNHDYHLANAQGYFDYFGARAPGPYYSYDLGAWHLISLAGDIDHSAGGAEEQWLKADLAAHPAQCILAYWHEPRFSSGSEHGSDSSFDPFWQDLYAARADVILNGHDHEYERFAPQNPAGQADPNGIQEFVAGTGGVSLYSFSTPVANSQVRNNTTFGVLKLTLHAGGYDWQFVPVAGSSFTDSGSGTC